MGLGAERDPMLRVKAKDPEVGRRMDGGEAVSCEQKGGREGRSARVERDWKH